MFSEKEKEIIRTLVEQEIIEARKSDIPSYLGIKRTYLRTLRGIFRKTRDKSYAHNDINLSEHCCVY